MPKMVVYKGTGSWEAFKFQFERTATKRRWSQRRKIDKLFDCLADVALEYTHKLAIHADYDRLMKELERRFARKDTPAVSRKQLFTLRQTDDESLEDWSQRVHFLTIDAFPGAEPNTIHQLSVETFLRGCKEKIAAEVAMGKDPVTIYKALKYVKQAINNHMALYGNKGSYSKRQVSFAEEPPGGWP
jgi:hypothetical protein